MVPNPADSSEQNENCIVQIAEMVEEYSEEYENLNSTLDQLDSCLDVLEQQSDSLYERMAQLLESNKQTRQEIEEANKTEAANGESGKGTDKTVDREGIDIERPKGSGTPVKEKEQHKTDTKCEEKKL